MAGSGEESQDSGYDIELFENAPDPEFICTICHGVLKHPMELGCQHVFCKSCITHWLTEKQECPYCRKKARSVARSVLPMIHNMIDRLIMKCENRVYGCQETFPLEQYMHHRTACEFRLIKCKYEACATEVFQKNLAAHEQVCEYWSQPCRMGCGVQLTQNQLEEHNCYRDVKRRCMEKIAVLESRLRRMHRHLKLVEGIFQNFDSGDHHFRFPDPIAYEDGESEDLAAEDQEDDSNTLDAELSENESQYSWNSSDIENGDGQPADNDDEGESDIEEAGETVAEQITEDTISVSSRSSTEQEASRTGSQTHLYFETDDGSMASENASCLSAQDAYNRKRLRPCMLQCSLRCRKSIWKRSNLSLKIFSRRRPR